VNATRVVKQLKDLLVEIDSLRVQVQDSDLEQFDKHTEKSRHIALNAIKTYLGKLLQHAFIKPLSSYVFHLYPCKLFGYLEAGVLFFSHNTWSSQCMVALKPR
jgi:hypothetical protein